MIITGANGVVGADLVKFFSKKNKVFAIYRTENKINKNLKNKNIKWIKQDLSKGVLKNIKSKIIIHCAVAHTLSKKKNYSDIVNSNIIGLRNILIFAKKNKIKKIFHLSSVALYGDIKSKILRERNPFINPEFYGLTKILMEKMVESQNMNYLNIRLPGIVGYQINDPRRPWLCKILNKLKNGQKVEIFNSEKNFNNIIDSYEIYKFLEHLILKKKFKSGSLNLSSNKPMKLSKIIYYMREKLNSKSKLFFNKKKSKHFIISSKKVSSEYNYKPSNTKEIIERYIKDFVKAN